LNRSTKQEEVKQKVIAELPSGAEDIRIKEEKVKKCWIASSIEFTFDIGYTKARVTIGDKEEFVVEPLTLEQVRKLTNAELCGILQFFSLETCS
jgi:ribosome-binding factor A